MNEIFEKIYNNNNTSLNEDTALFEKVYTEAEMLNEMNPKLRALLAAGLIGTAGLGAVSCSMPTDDPYDAQYTIEQPTPENPEEIEEIENSEESTDFEDSEDFEDLENPEEIEEIEDSEDSEEITDSEDSEDFEDLENPEDSEYTVTFETLGVEEYAESLARAIKIENGQAVAFDDEEGWENFIYKNGFIPASFNENNILINPYDKNNKALDSCISYIDPKAKIAFHVPIKPINLTDTVIAKLDKAIKNYNAIYNK